MNAGASIDAVLLIGGLLWTPPRVAVQQKTRGSMLPAMLLAFASFASIVYATDFSHVSATLSLLTSLMLAYQTHAYHINSNIVALSHVVRSLRLCLLPESTASVGQIGSALAHLFLFWIVLTPNAKRAIHRHIRGALNIDGISLIRASRRQPISREELKDSVKRQQIVDDIQRLKFNTEKRFYVLRAVLPLVWKPLSAIMVLKVIIEKVPHLQRFVMVDIFSNHTQDSDNSRVYMLCGVWALLALAPLLNSYIFRSRHSIFCQTETTVVTSLASTYMARKGSAQLSEEFNYIRYNRMYWFICYAFQLAEIVFNALISIAEMWLLATKIGWAAMLPVITMVAHSIVSQLTRARIERLKKLSKSKKQPSFRTNYRALINNIRTVKFYGWERAFDDAVSWVDEADFVPPVFWRVLQFIIDLIGSSTTEIASALAVTAYMSTSPDLKYTDVMLIMSSSANLTLFVTSCMQVTWILREMQKVMERIDRLLKGDESTYITQLPAKGSVSVDLQDAAFQWGQDKFALKPAALQINSGEFAVVVGRIGSGKSSLLSAICGEMPLTSGRGYVYGRIGYVSQKPWIMNTTLRENILCGRPFDQDFYRSVIDACALADDIKLFPAKDLSEIGHKGINLSGGQKVRLALARAVYSRADIYVLDDLLAAVDAYVERQLVDNVLVGNGILAGKTRILVTHAEHIVPYADKVMTLEDGHITLVDQDPAQCAITRPVSPTISGTGSDSDCGDSGSDHFTYKPDTDVKKYEWSYMWRCLQLCGPAVVLASLTFQAVTTYGIYRVENLRMDSMMDKNPETMAASIRNYVIVNAFVGIFSLQLAKIRMWLRKTLWADAVAKDTRKQVLDAATHMPLPLVESLPNQRLHELFFSCRYAVSGELSYEFNNYAATVFCSIKTMVQMSERMPKLLIIIAPYLAARYYLKSVSSSARKTVDEAWRPEGSVDPDTQLDELVAGCETLRITSSLPQLVDEMRVLQADDHIYTYVFSMSFTYVVYLADCICEAAMKLTVFAIQIHQSLDPTNNIGLAEAEVVLDLSKKFLSGLKSLVNANEPLHRLLPSLARYFIYVELPSEAPGIIEDSRPPSNWPNAGTIEFRDYGMRYRDDTDMVLRSIALSVRPREKIGIVGRTGAGKSSLTHALLRMVEPAQGSIHIDGVDIATIGLHDLRSVISVIPQDPSLFVGTIRENLDPMNEFTDDQVWSAIRKGQIEDLVNTPTSSYDKEKDEKSGPWVAGVGLNKWVEGGGENFSVGQRQLVSLCRALLWQRKILILDEATANVDTATDRAVQRIIRQEFAECTILTIAHRLDTVMDSDRILVLDKGQVAEFDSPANLLARDSLFATLVASMELNKARA